MGSPCITPATLRDLPRLAALLAGTEDGPAAAKAERGLCHALAHPERAAIFVLRSADKILGLASLFETVSTAEGGSVALLQDLVVAPEARRQGYGTMLLRHTIENARTRGLRRITLLAEAPLPLFFQKHGFASSGMIPLRRTFAPQTGSATTA